MKVVINSPADVAVEAVRQLLSPWLVEYVPVEEAGVVIAYKTVEEVGKARFWFPQRRWSFVDGLKGLVQRLLKWAVKGGRLRF